jgi:hypothetical protein
VERIDASASGRVEVVGRWFGVRGRRFVRPALTLGRKDGEIRALADLDHKPWAAEDGEVWRAAFSVESGLDDAREIELTVAPDIVVPLRAKGRKLAAPGATLAVAQAARPSRAAGGESRSAPPAGGTPAGSDGEPRRRASPSAELERLGARLAAANHALEQERERRAALAKTLEEERTTNRNLRTELGQARSELEIAAAARAEAAEAEAELEAARRELREAQRRHEALTRQHEEATRDLTSRHEEATQKLTEHAEALESTRQALAEERAESGRLRNRLTQAQEARQQRTGAPPAAVRPEPAAAASEPRASRRAASRSAAEQPAPDPLATQRYDIESLTRDLDTRTPPAPAPTRGPAPAPARAPAAAPSRTPAPAAGRRETRRSAPAPSDPPAWNPPTAERLRPVNPSLRHRTYWFGRLLALLVLLGVIAAVWIVLHSTVLH